MQTTESLAGFFLIKLGALDGKKAPKKRGLVIFTTERVADYSTHDSLIIKQKQNKSQENEKH